MSNLIFDSKVADSFTFNVHSFLVSPTLYFFPFLMNFPLRTYNPLNYFTNGGIIPPLLPYRLSFLFFNSLSPNQVVLLQVSLTTASESNTNEESVSQIVSRVNSRFGNIEYTPLVYLHQDIEFGDYLGLLSVADACLITSLRDGMNLTSHEYVVCQQEKKSPLIISEFAGTYGSFGAALRVNPWDTREVSEAIFDALTMSEEEKEARWKVNFLRGGLRLLSGRRFFLL